MVTNRELDPFTLLPKKPKGYSKDWKLAAIVIGLFLLGSLI